MRVLFWSSAGLLLYTYLVFPILLLLLSTLWQLAGDLRFAVTRRSRRQRGASQPPAVSLVFCAHNEEDVIAEKLRNCEALEYPRDRLEILVGCDGCDDRTVPLIREQALPHLRLFEFARVGKPAGLNRLVPEARGEIVVFCDANTMLRPDAVRSLVRHFADPEVGCVCGELRLLSRADDHSEGIYWKFETFLKFLESRLNMMVGSNGGIFAIRRSLYEPLPAGSITDDFLISMRVRARGRRVVYDPEAVALEEARGTREEFRRRVRIGAGNLHALRHTAALLSPTAGLVCLSYWSHKIFRWMTPAALLLNLASSLALAGNWLYATAAVLNLAAIGMAAGGYILESRKTPIRLFSLAYHFLSLNAALLVGSISYLAGMQGGIWRPTARKAQEKAA